MKTDFASQSLKGSIVSLMCRVDMLHPVSLSPPPPAIIEVLSSADSISCASETQFLSLITNHKNPQGHKPASPPPQETFTPSQTAACVGKSQTFANSLHNLQTPNTKPNVPVAEAKATPQGFDDTNYTASFQPVHNTLLLKSRHTSSQTSNPSTIELRSPTSLARQRTIEVISDRQEYDQIRRIVTAVGNVVVRFDGAVVDADRLQVNLDNLIAVGSGNVALTRGDQVLRGERFTYNFIQDNGEIENGSGEIFIPSAQQDFAFSSSNVTPVGIEAPVSDRVRRNQPLTQITSPGGIDFTLGGIQARNVPLPVSGGEVRRLRFEAQRISFYPRGWQAFDVRITNDPFSPPELELRASQVTSIRESPVKEIITTRRQRLVFDQKISLPIPVDKQTIDSFERDASPFLVSPGFDGDKRGGLFLERGLTTVDTQQVRWRITPQLFVQKALEGGTDNLAELLGVTTSLNAVLNPRLTLEGGGELTSLNNLEQNLQVGLRMRQVLGDVNPHVLSLEYTYRDRLYNGSLGFQTVQSSLGGLITSPIIPLGNTGVNLSYQAGLQYINANTDRLDLLGANANNNRISLGRLQASASLSRGFLLWRGQSLPPTATQGLKYTPNPVVPYIETIASLRGTSSYYSNNENQSTLTAIVGLVGQFGNFSRPYLDYTAFNLTYSQGLNSGLSPFLFDRSVDTKLLSFGTQVQIYGPFVLGWQTAINLDTGRETSTDYTLQYSRRTYGITLRYNPILELGGFTIRISDFNWVGGTDPFSGVRQDN